MQMDMIKNEKQNMGMPVGNPANVKHMQAYDKKGYMAKTEMSSGFYVDFSSNKDNQVYGKAAKSFEDVQNETSLLDGASVKNYMAVMASTVSGEDYQKMTEDGIRPGKAEPAEAVTIMDHIKAVMASSGQIIEGFNGENDLSMEELTGITGDVSIANAISAQFASKDIPLTKENATEAMSQLTLGAEITALSKQMKAYLLENQLDPTLANLYTAKYAAGNGSQLGQGGYFADDLNGYFGKATSEIDMEQLKEQLGQVITEADLEVSEETLGDCKWLMERNLLLTPENLRKLDEMKKVELPFQKEELLSSITSALQEGKKAQDANPFAEGLYEKAERIVKETKELSDKVVSLAMEKNQVLNLRNLQASQKQIVMEESVNTFEAVKTSTVDTSLQQEDVMKAQRLLASVKLSMQISTNVLMLKQNMNIETMPLNELVDEINAIQERQETMGLRLAGEGEQTLFENTMQVRAGIKEMPVAVLGRIAAEIGKYSLGQVYQQGKIVEGTYKAAGESYEALMTAPRADLGDKIKNAFRNIDELLKQQDLEVTEGNERAVRILAYNQMEITKENVNDVRMADESLQNLIQKMNPQAVLNMIKEDVNPLELTVAQLDAYFAQQEGSFENTNEKFSKFLYKLEKTEGISKEERDSYIGVFRLLRQIEKGDGAAIGRVVANGQELTFSNLLSAIRSGKKAGMNQVIDDSFGGLTEIEQKGNSISEQIGSAYKKTAGNLLASLDPATMQEKEVNLSMTWEEFEKVMAEESQKESDMKGYYQQEAQSLRESFTASPELMEFLESQGVAITGDNLLAASKWQKSRGEMVERLQKAVEFARNLENSQEEDTENIADIGEDLLELPLSAFTDRESANKAMEQFVTRANDVLEMQMLQDDMGYLDVKALSLVSKQLSLSQNLAKRECYELPAIIDGQLTQVSVRFEKEAAAKNQVRISMSLSEERRFEAQLFVNENKVTGMIATNQEQFSQKVQEKMSDFSKILLSEMGKEADIHIVYSKEMKDSAFGNMESAPARKQVTGKESSEEVQGSRPSANQLYNCAKTLLTLMR